MSKLPPQAADLYDDAAVYNISDDDEGDEVAVFNLLDEDDDILANAEDSIQAGQMDTHEDDAIQLDDIDFDEEMAAEDEGNISIGIEPSTSEVTDGFDPVTGNLWIYPTNYSVRDYQYNIVQKALYNNTLAVLPTGLGKTFIAAVVMYNFYRWYPQGKIVFMAPTKPLVAQQITACYNIMGIPKRDTVEMTGTMAPAIRQKAWKEKRVVFLTPQVMTNDLSRGSCVAESIKCLVIDEAHKALGNHAYCQVVKELVKFTRQFRVLALSATPGSDLKAVQQVINNLLISHIELRSEESLDIRPYTHERKVEKVVVSLGEELAGIRLQYIQIMNHVIQRLIRNRVVYNREATKLSKFLLLKSREEFRQNPPANLPPAQHGTIEADFGLAISLYHGYELLHQHGLRSLYNYLTSIITGVKGHGKTKTELLRNADFNNIMDALRSKFSNQQGKTGATDVKIAVGHPKMQRLEEIVVEHFKTFEKKNEETRVMIFSQYRDSVQEIAAILNQHQPLVKVMPFIGQSSAGKVTKGYTQKEQLLVMQQFRSGGYNTLVSTCVGEEGLDIGDVDLIVCFDAHKSPIRLVQRMGRTGRKRQGRIVMLVTEGKEEQIYNQSQYSKKSIHKAILNGAKTLHFYPSNPRMLPASVHPKCHQMHITVASSQSKETKKTATKPSVANRSKRISDMFGSRGMKKDAPEDYLLAEEFESIKEEFSLMASTARHIPRPKCITLTKSKPLAAEAVNVIDFAEWMPWQNRLQKTFLVGHSIQSEHLVKDVEFIDLQYAVGDHDDSYGYELSKYLDSEATDISKAGQSSIVSFLTTRPGPKSSERTAGNKVRCKKKVRKKESFDAEVDETALTESIVVSSDSSGDEQPRQKMKDGTGSRAKTFSKTLTNKSPVLRSKVSKMRTNNTAKLKSKGKLVKPKKSGKSVSEASVSESAADKWTADRRKISRRSILEKLETELPGISNNLDIEDFEDTSRDQSCSYTLLKKACQTVREDSNPHVTTYVDTEAPPCDGAISPTFNTHGKDACVPADTSATVVPSDVPPPPNCSHVAKLFQGIKSGLEFSDLDIEELVEKWQRSEREECLALMKSNHDEFLPSRSPILTKSILKNSSKSLNQSYRLDTSFESRLMNKQLALNDHTNIVQTVCCRETNSGVHCRGKATNSDQEKKVVLPQLCNTPNSRLKATSCKGLRQHSTPVGKLVSKRLKFAEDVQPETKEVTFNLGLPKEDEHIADSVEPTSPATAHDIEQKVQAVFNLFDFSMEDDDIDWGRLDAVCVGSNRTQACRGIAQTSPASCQAKITSHTVHTTSSTQAKIAAHTVHTPSSTQAKIAPHTPSSTHNAKFAAYTPSSTHKAKIATHTPSSTSKAKSANSSHSESFLTFTQVMDCLETSSACSSQSTPGRVTNNIAGLVSPAPSQDIPSYFGLSNRPKYFQSDSNSSTQWETVSHEQKYINKTSVAENRKLCQDHDEPCLFSTETTPTKQATTPTKQATTPTKQETTPTKHETTPTKQETTPINQKASPPTPGSDNLEMPQFDLGFDLDDIIPPTPDKNLSQTSTFSLKYQKSACVLSADVKDEASKLPAHSYQNKQASQSSAFELCVQADDTSYARERKELPEKVSPSFSSVCNFSLGGDSCQSSPDSPVLNSFIGAGAKPFSGHTRPVATVQPALGWTGSNSPPPRLVNSGQLQDMTDDSAVLDAVSACHSGNQTAPSKLKLPFNTYSTSVSSPEQQDGNKSQDIKNTDIWTGYDKQQSPPTGADESVVSAHRSSVSKPRKLQLGRKRDSTCNKSASSSSDGHSLSHQTANVTSDSHSLSHQTANVTSDGHSLSHQTTNVTSDHLSVLSNSEDEVEKHSEMFFSKSKFKQHKASPGVSVVSLAPGEVQHKDSPGVSVLSLAPGEVQHKTSPVVSVVSLAPGENRLLKASTPKRPLGSLRISSGSELELTPIEKPQTRDKQDDEESFIRRRKKKTTAINFSTDEDDETREVTHNTWIKASKKKVKPLLEDIAAYDFSDFEEKPSFNLPSRKKIKIERKKLKEKGFIEEEAEVSGDSGSSDEREEGDDFYEASFIDNNTELMHSQSTDMRAMYLKSVKSPVLNGIAGRFKLQYNKKVDVDIYSQAVPEDQGMSEYEEDSFCVGSDDVDSYLSSDESHPKKSKKVKSKKARKLPGKRRIHVVVNSSSEDEAESRVALTQEFSVVGQKRASVVGHKRARRALLSSSDDDNKSTAGVVTTNNSFNFSVPSAKVVHSHASLAIQSENNSALQAEVCQGLEKSSFQVDTGNCGNEDNQLINGNWSLFEEEDWFADLDDNQLKTDVSDNPPASSSQIKKDSGDVGNIGHDKSRGDQSGDGIVSPGLLGRRSFNVNPVSNKDGSATTTSTTTSSTTSASTSATTSTPCGDRSDSCAPDLSSSSCEKTKPPCVLTREERLKKQKEKQEKFRQKLKQVQQSCGNLSSIDQTAHQTAHNTTADNSSHPNVGSLSDTSFTKLVASKRVEEQLQILVDSREISGAQDIISNLRQKHNIKVTARQLSSCDYMLSNYMAADRMHWSVFSNSSNRSKMTSRLSEMQSLYDTCVLVVETDKVKSGQEKVKKSRNHTKYLDVTMASLIKTGIKMYFTDNVEETTTLLAELCVAEFKKGRAIGVPTLLSSKQEEMLKFVLSIPRVTVPQALNIVHKFSTLAEFVRSPPDVIKARGQMRSCSALAIHQFLNHKFDLQMMPNSKR